MMIINYVLLFIIYFLPTLSQQYAYKAPRWLDHQTKKYREQAISNSTVMVIAKSWGVAVGDNVLYHAL